MTTNDSCEGKIIEDITSLNHQVNLIKSACSEQQKKATEGKSNLEGSEELFISQTTEHVNVKVVW